MKSGHRPGERDMGTSPFGFSHLRLARIRESIKIYLYLLVRSMSLQMRCLKMMTHSADACPHVPLVPISVGDEIANIGHDKTCLTTTQEKATTP
jgi:hypothetical protein